MHRACPGRAFSKSGREGKVCLQNSLARDYVEVHRSAFPLNRIELPDPDTWSAIHTASLAAVSRKPLKYASPR